MTAARKKTDLANNQSKISSTLDSTTKTSAAEAMPTLVPLLTFVSASGDSSRSWSRYCIAPGTCPASCSRDRVFCKEKPQALNPLEPPQEIYPRTQPPGLGPGPTTSRQGRHGDISWTQTNRSSDKFMVMRQVQG